MRRSGSRSAKKGIPDAVKARIEQRLLAYAEAEFAGRYARIEVRFRGDLCYVDAYEEPQLPPGFPWPGCTQTAEEYLQSMRDVPIHLCRLRYLGDENLWEPAIYTYSGERYETLGMGGAATSPEDLLEIAAGLYLQ